MHPLTVLVLLPHGSLLGRTNGYDWRLAGADSEPLSMGAQCAYNCDMTSMKAERLHLRVDPEQKALLEAASRAAGDTVSGFVLRAATEAAADVLADRRVFALDQQAWQVFDQALSRPATEVAGLRELLFAPTVLDRDPAEPPPGPAGR
jgi:uncharacterized protein (DUF1778 family)